jgi:hypothetical protein
LLRVFRLRVSRNWISQHGTKRQRHTTVVFVLRHPSVVQFIVVRISPDCHRVGRFRVVGHRGVNRVRLGPRVGRHSLRPGTYRLIARAVPGGRTVVDTGLVVATHPSHDEIEAASGADTCSPATHSEGGAQAFGTSGTHSTAGPTDSKTAASASKPARHQGVLGARFVRKAAETASRVPLWLYMLVAIAIVLLAAGAFLPKARPAGLAASLVAGLTGAVVLLVAMVAYIVF